MRFRLYCICKPLTIKKRDVVGIERKSLVDGVLRRDESAFREAIQTYTKLLWAVADSILNGCDGYEQDVEECVSDVFIYLWNNIKQFDPARGSLKSYLVGIAKSNAINRYHKKSRERVVQLEDYMEKADEEKQLETKDYSRLYEEVKKLPEPTREIMVRRFFYDEKPARIAEKMGLPKKEIDNRLYRGKKALSASLSDIREVM